MAALLQVVLRPGAVGFSRQRGAVVAVTTAPHARAEELTLAATIALAKSVGAEPVELDWSGDEPFGSVALDGLWVLDFTATLREAE